jgi:hypothetical protein
VAAREQLLVAGSLLAILLAGCSTPRHHGGLRVAARELFCGRFAVGEPVGGLLHPACASGDCPLRHKSRRSD